MHTINKKEDSFNDKFKFCFFEWVVIDNCNLDCSYCVNKGEYSQKDKSLMKYIPGIESQVAQKIRAISPQFEKVVVNLTGGEPTIAPNIVQAVKELATAENIEIRLITNLRATNCFEEIAPFLSSVTVSLHVGYSSNEDVEKIISVVNSHKNKLPIVLTQVDHELSTDAHVKLARIEAATGMPIIYQKFIPPWTDAGKVEKGDEISAANFGKSMGKRCALGFFYFFIGADGMLNYDLWCSRTTAKVENFLTLTHSNLKNYILEDMKKCFKSSCGCNYNFFNYEEYLSACRRLGYDTDEMFGFENREITDSTEPIHLDNNWLTRLRNKVAKLFSNS